MAATSICVHRGHRKDVPPNLIDSRDRDFQRILWIDESTDRVQKYQLLTVTYGTASAPFLALRVLKQLIINEGGAFPLASSVLTNHIYVDDVLFGAEDIPLLRRAREQICDLLAKGGFTLCKWASNKSELLNNISPENHGLACNRPLKLDDHINILGLSWNPVVDAFQFSVLLSTSCPHTKRSVLSAIAKLFDPLGWVTPITITAKIFMQELWRLQINWDEALPPPSSTRWAIIYRNLSHLNGLKIDRWTGRGSDTARCEVHGFADASTAAYAAVIYMRVISLSGDITVKLLIGKSQVAPLKPMSVPRLELSAATLLAKLLEFIRESFNFKIDAFYCWTDSTVALAWVRSHSSRWKTFVSNRVADIQTCAPDAKWMYVSTRDNPAECASRGLLASELTPSSIWWHGPNWLHRSDSSWPAQPSSVDTTTSDESKGVNAHITCPPDRWDLASRYSTWPKLIRITAYLIRFGDRCRQRKGKSNDDSKKSLALTHTECR
ncbi:uncharacterized protein LOC118647349 [Monomorium pharaonis]|uniref:uncharacterized protein LOC118647349 n=1 Tax=Monomorium pharaonis TaxID=307658 RepID=UPI001747270E|nr:uncharacterized protein LOC118647349 [Monomorium pharaonis]